MPYGQPLPNQDHVTRGCSRGHDNGEITSSAFDMRPAERNLLTISVDWVQCPYDDPNTRNPEGSAKRLRSRPVDPPYAILPVADIRQVRRGDLALDVKEYGNTGNACHCGIDGFLGTPIDLEFQRDLAEIANRSPILE